MAVDLNPRQNALLEMKLACVQKLSYEQFWALFSAEGAAAERKAILDMHYSKDLRPLLSEQARAFWDDNQSELINGILFAGMSGLAARGLMFLARVFGLGGLIDGVKHCNTIEEQKHVFAQYSSRISIVINLVHATRHFWCPFIAVPASQIALSDGNIAERAMHNLFLNTHISKDNYHFFGYFYGHYTKECCPRYLQEEHFAKLKANAHRVRVEYGTLQEAASRYEDGHFNRMVLLDHMDWMPNSMILDEWSVFMQKSAPDCVFLWRSYAEHQHIAPLSYLTFHQHRVEDALTRMPDRVGMYNTTWLATKTPNFEIVPRNTYAPPATLKDDMTVLFSNFVKPISGGDHKARLASFYAAQAGSYDTFRHRFLHGRVPMVECMPVIKGGVWLDMGGGTASNLELMGDTIDAGLWSQVYVLDLCAPLLEVAKQRVKARGWGSKVSLIEGDATDISTPGLPAPGTVDVLTFSYALTMIPDWQQALQVAKTLLKPGGFIAIGDFTVTKKHSLWTRTFWPFIFQHDGVNLNAQHIQMLRATFDEVHRQVNWGGFPYVPLLQCPYYVFVGRKSAGGGSFVHNPSTGKQSVMASDDDGTPMAGGGLRKRVAGVFGSAAETKVTA